MKLAAVRRFLRNLVGPDESAYVLASAEYVPPSPPPGGDLFADPAEVERMLALTRDSINKETGR